MGDYTTVVDEDLNIKDKEGLKNYLEKIKKKEIYKDKKIHEYAKALTDSEDAKDNENIMSFFGWDGYKIISYWYGDMVTLLRDLAIFIEGTVNLEFGDYDERTYINFSKGKCEIRIGEMKYTDYEPESIGHPENITAMPEEVKKLQLINKLWNKKRNRINDK